VRTTIIIAGILILLLIGLIVTHEVIESKVFSMLTNRADLQLSFEKKSGNLLSGYTLQNVRLRPDVGQRGGTRPNVMIHRVSFKWGLFPFALSTLSWEPGRVEISADDSETIEVVFSGSSLSREGSFLTHDEEITIGPPDWDGSADIEVASDASEIRGDIVIERFPARLISLVIPENNQGAMMGHAIVEVRILGPLTAMKFEGLLTNPLTGQTQGF